MGESLLVLKAQSEGHFSLSKLEMGLCSTRFSSFPTLHYKVVTLVMMFIPSTW